MAYVVFEDIYDARNACSKLNGFNFGDRYLVGRNGHAQHGLTYGAVSYFPERTRREFNQTLAARQAALDAAKREYGIS